MDSPTGNPCLMWHNWYLTEIPANMWEVLANPSPCCWVEGHFSTIISHSAFQICLSHPFWRISSTMQLFLQVPFSTQPLRHWFSFANSNLHQQYPLSLKPSGFPVGLQRQNLQISEKNWWIFMSWFFCLTQANRSGSLRVYIAPKFGDLCRL